MGRFKMILWSKPKDFSIEDMVDIAYKILQQLKNYGDEINPKYITARSKSLAKEFNLDKDSIKSLLEKQVDKISLKAFNRLTSRISFFSSMDDDKCSGIRIGLGNHDPLFSNTCVVHLLENFSGLAERRNEFVDLFKQLIESFEPYYAFVSNDSDDNSGKGFWQNNKPTNAHWMNYFDTITADSIGLNAVLSIVGGERLKNGYFFMLQDEPLDVNNSEQMQKQGEVRELLGL